MRAPSVRSGALPPRGGSPSLTVYDSYTARFLARMVAHVGLLSMGNEEMVPFAYKVYQDYENPPKGQAEMSTPYMITFRAAFCRHECEDSEGHGDHKDDAPAAGGIKVHFVGLFDTVGSVASFDTAGTPHQPTIEGTARHIRHAVAIDERRVKFKPSLLQQDEHVNKAKLEDSKEVWFPGNHGDVGGGWPPEDETPPKSQSWGDWFRRLVGRARKDVPEAATKAHLDKSKDWFQLSDFALKWMVDELDGISGDDHVLWSREKADFLERFAQAGHRSGALKARIHDTMRIGGGAFGGSNFGKVLMWNILGASPACSIAPPHPTP